MSADDGNHSRRLHIFVTGRVQGVGFRAFVVSQADRREITGWVQNGPDGRTVEVLAEGTDEALTQFVNALRQGPPGAHVDDVKQTEHTASGRFQDFAIRY